MLVNPLCISAILEGMFPSSTRGHLVSQLLTGKREGGYTLKYLWRFSYIILWCQTDTGLADEMSLGLQRTLL